jgi:eukaryotic-like serine/threonine-protein kinase
VSERNPGFIGPYVVLEQLGRGGMGVVYRARDPDSGAPVAVKTVIVPDIRALAGIRREIHALQRLRHPGVVRVLGQGVHRGLPWYAMELLTCRTLAEDIQKTWATSGLSIPGRTEPHIATPSHGMDLPTLASDSRLLHQPEGFMIVEATPASRFRATGVAPAALDHTLADWSAQLAEVPYRKEVMDITSEAAIGPRDPDLPRPPAAAGEMEQKLGILLRLAEILVVVHGAGVVHRDIKPENIFVRDTGEPVLVDFGLAAYGAAGREILGDPSMAAGTLQYMAPEQLRGEYVDARGDLYSLGCILYECLTGRPPFPDTNKGSVVFQQLHALPAPPSHYVDGVPPRLDALALALLAKSQRDRIGYASDVVVELGAILGAPAALPPSVVTACHQLYRPSFTGRDGEMARLLDHLDGLGTGQGAVVLVRGASGAGKTRLLMEFLRRVSPRQAQRVTGECVAVGLDEHPDLRIAAPLLHPFDRLLRHVADRCHYYGPDETARLLGRDLRDLRVLAEFEPALLSVPGADRAAEIPPLPGDAARQRVMDALWRLLATMADELPLVVGIDDLQWADELSLAFLDMLRLRDLSRVPVLVIAACRDRELPGALQALIGSGAFEILALGPLDEVSIHLIIGDMLALDERPSWLIEHLDPDHAGNPFYVAEFVQMVREQNVLERSPTGRWQITRAPEHLPRSLEAVCRQRLRALAPMTRHVVEVASIMGRVLDVDMLARVGAVPEAQVLDAVDELILHKLVQKDMSGALSFVHEVICKVARDELAETTRRALHGTTARALESDGVDPRELPLLAHHYGCAGIKDKAFEYLVKNARTTLDAGAHQQAMLMMERAWALAGETGSLVLPVHERANALLLTAEAAFGLGRLDTAESRALEVLELHGYPVPRTGLAWVAGLLRGIGGQLVSAAVRRRSASSARPGQADRGQADRGQAKRGQAKRGQANIDRARALALLQRLYVARSEVLRVMASCFMAANEAERAGPPTSPALAYSIIGSACGSMGLTGVAAGYFGRAQELARSEGNAHTEVSVAITEHLYYLGAGMWEPLENSAERCLALAWDIGARFEWEALMMIWQTYRLRRHGCAGVREALDQVIASAEARANPLSGAFAQTRAAECALAVGEHAMALDMAGAARRVFADSGPPAMSARAEALMASCLFERGAYDEAGVAATGALAALQSTMLLHLHEDGCRHVAEVFLGLWERARVSGSKDAAALRKKALAACKLMRGQAQRFPASRPPARRLAGAALRIGGQPQKAGKLLELALVQARAADTLPEQGLILLEMARCHAPGSAQRERCLASARALLEHCGWSRASAIIESLSEMDNSQ